MNKNWKILFVGLGSAGQRHMRNLEIVLGDNVQFLAFRQQGLAKVYDNNFNIVENETLKSRFHLIEYKEFAEALKQKPDIVFITNPNSMHVPFALKAVKAGCDIFIEKPISNSIDGVKELITEVENRGVIAYVGYQYRLHPCIQKAKYILDNGIIGSIVTVQVEIGELLSSMHKYEKYWEMNEAQKIKGGGVVLCQLHELDYLYYLFGLPNEVYSVGGKKSYMNIDVEDTASTICKYGDKEKGFAVMIHQDFLQNPPVRRCKFIGEYGKVEIDLLSNVIQIYNEGRLIEQEHLVDFDRNDMFIDEILQLLECVKNRSREFVSLKDGMGSLNIALAIKKSMESGEIVKIKDEHNAKQ